MRFYAQSTGCTYLHGIHRSMPSDAVPISEELFLAAIARPHAGKIRSHVDGLPVLIDPPPATADQLAELERTWRDTELLAVTWLRDRHRDQLDTSAQTTLSTEQFAELLAYMQSLRDWPQSELFPDTTQRPAPPTWIAGQTR